MAALLHAGAAQTDITPPLGSVLAGSFHPRYAEDVDDPLYAKAVVLDDGSTRLAIVALDIISILAEDVRKIRKLIAEHTGISPQHVMIGCTHTHTGPAPRSSHAVIRDDAYMEWLVHRVSDSVRLAARRLRPARLAWGQGEQHDISFCRRYRMKDGTVRMNPGKGNPDIVEPTSPIDPTVGVVYIQDEQGTPISVIAQFSLHYVGTDNGNAISADYYGHFAAVMRRHLGQECVPLLLNGTSGQINNMNPFDPHQLRGHAQARRVAQALAGEVLKVMGRMRYVETPALAAVATPVELPAKRVTPEDVTIAKQILAGNDPMPDRGPFSYVVGQPIPASLRPVYANHVLSLIDMPSTIQTEVQALRIGESAWVALPGEIFVEIGLAIKEASPSADTFVVGLCNDSLGYIATDHALTAEGGYETWAGTGSRVGVGAEGILVETAGKLLRDLFGKQAERAG